MNGGPISMWGMVKLLQKHRHRARRDWYARRLSTRIVGRARVLPYLEHLLLQRAWRIAGGTIGEEFRPQNAVTD